MTNVSIYDYLDAAQQVIREGKSVPVPVIGKSMFPFLRDGRDIVVLKRKAAYRRGDIVLFRSRDRGYILHRIISVKNGNMLTCGDGNQKSDGWTPVSEISCAAVAIERNGKRRSPDSFLLRHLARLWMTLYPIRPTLLKTYRLAGMVRRKLKIRGR